MQAMEDCTPTVEVGPSAFFPRPFMPNLYEQKNLLRQTMRAKRLSFSQSNPNSANQLVDLFKVYIQLQPGLVVASYHAFRDEMDPALLVTLLRNQGHPITLPVIIDKGQPLLFRLYDGIAPLAPNAMGILQPVDSAPVVEPDILLVPLLAFDRNRNRLGYGGGFYDRTIKGLRQHKPVLTIGIAYACQEVVEVPIGKNDVQLDKIVTDVNVF